MVKQTGQALPPRGAVATGACGQCRGHRRPGKRAGLLVAYPVDEAVRGALRFVGRLLRLRLLRRFTCFTVFCSRGCLGLLACFALACLLLILLFLAGKFALTLFEGVVGLGQEKARIEGDRGPVYAAGRVDVRTIFTQSTNAAGSISSPVILATAAKIDNLPAFTLHSGRPLCIGAPACSWPKVLAGQYFSQPSSVFRHRSIAGLPHVCRLPGTCFPRESQIISA